MPFRFREILVPHSIEIGAAIFRIGFFLTVWTQAECHEWRVASYSRKSNKRYLPPPSLSQYSYIRIAHKSVPIYKFVLKTDD